MSARLQAQFLESAAGRILVTARRAAGASGVLIVPPFAEELNKSRRLVTDLAGALAARGISSVNVDLYGTGDSDGEFADARVERWIADLALAVQWSADQGIDIQGLVAVRMGCLLAPQLARRAALGIRRTVFWQPVLEGARMLDQFLRLRVAAQMAEDGPKETVAALRNRLRAERVEIAGYEVSPGLAADLDALRLESSLASALGVVHWIEILRSADAPLAAASTRFVERLRSSCCEVAVQKIIGDPFWASTELVTSAALIDASVQAFCEPS